MNQDIYKLIQSHADRLQTLCRASGLDQEAKQAGAIRESAILAELDFYETHGPIIERKN